MVLEKNAINTLLDNFLDLAIKEDVGAGDHTSIACIPEDSRTKAKLLAKEPGIIAGVEVAAYIFRKVDETAIVDIKKEDGGSVLFRDVVFEVEANTRKLLQIERIVLNIMQRMSGIATLSNQYKFEVEDLPVTILDTRKTTPTLRFLEKMAVKLGGCTNYRHGLYDRFMIKDNHIDACGSIKKAIEQVNQYKKDNNLDLQITVEVRNLVELYEVLEAGNIDRIMLDNFELPLLYEAVAIINEQYETEASGGVNLHTVRKVAQSGVNYISIGALTHSATSLDLSLKVVSD